MIGVSIYQAAMKLTAMDSMRAPTTGMALGTENASLLHNFFITSIDKILNNILETCNIYKKWQEDSLSKACEYSHVFRLSL